MNGPETTTTAFISAPARRACLVDGCSCKDSRIVSPRRAAYYASIAATRGETADRIIAVEPGWAISGDVDILGSSAIDLINDAAA